MAITVASIPPMVSNCYLHLVKENVTTLTQEMWDAHGDEYLGCDHNSLEYSL